MIYNLPTYCVLLEQAQQDEKSRFLILLISSVGDSLRNIPKIKVLRQAAGSTDNSESIPLSYPETFCSHFSKIYLQIFKEYLVIQGSTSIIVWNSAWDTDRSTVFSKYQYLSTINRLNPFYISRIYMYPRSFFHNTK